MIYLSGKKFNKPSFGYYEFISAGYLLKKLTSSDSYHTTGR